MDNRNYELAKMLVEYSIEVKENEIVRIIAHCFESKPLVKELIKVINEKKAIAVTEFVDHEVSKLELQGATDKRFEYTSKWELEKTQDMDAIIFIRGLNNEFEMAAVDQGIVAKSLKANKVAQNIRVNERKWVLLNYPTITSALKAKMAYDDYCDYYYDVMLVDYPKMKRDAEALKSLFEKTDKVRITGKNTDISFSIKDIPAVICAGDRNVPDGEVYSAPVKDSVNGKIQYSTISTAQNVEFKNVCLEVENGKIINATSELNNDKLDLVFNSDEGARYFGEFAIGLNPMVLEPVGDILFDEKIYGSFHLTPGQAYQESYNGNDSVIHWDLVCIQRPEYGGGEIYFDDVLIRKDGNFVHPDLLSLNKQ